MACGLSILAMSVKLEKTAGRRRGPDKMPMAALRLSCRPCVLSASPRLALDISQVRRPGEPGLATLVVTDFSGLPMKQRSSMAHR